MPSRRCRHRPGGRQRSGAIHTRAPPPASRAPPIPPARSPRRTRRRGSSAPAPSDGAERKRVVEPHAGDVVLDDLQDVIQIDRAEREAEHEAERADAERLDPDRPPDLAAQSADRPQDAELAPPIGDRHGQRVDDAENRDEHGDRDLHRRQAEPLIGHLQDVALELAGSSARTPDAGRRSARESAAARRAPCAPGFR